MNPETSLKLRHISLLLMVLICFIHSYNISQTGWGETPPFWLRLLETFISDGICRSAVPLFFAISGYLAGQSLPETFSFSYYRSLLKKKFHTLLVPYLLVNGLGIVFVISLQFIPWTAGFIQGYQLERTTPGHWLYIWLLSPVPYPLWFVRFLFLYFLLFPVLYFLTKYFKLVYLLFGFYLWYSFQMQSVMRLSKLQAEGLFFFSFGLFLGMEKISPILRIRQIYVWLLTIVWLGWIMFRSQHLIRFPLDHGVNHYHLIGFTFLGTLVCWLLYDQLPKSWQNHKWLQQLSLYAIGIFLFHEPTLTIYKKLIIKILGNTAPVFFLNYFLAPILAFFTAYGFSRLLSAWLPRWYATLTGNRVPALISRVASPGPKADIPLH